MMGEIWTQGEACYLSRLIFGNGEGYDTPAVHEAYRKSASSVYFAVSGSSGLYISEEGSNETAPCNVAFNYIVRAA